LSELREGVAINKSNNALGMRVQNIQTRENQNAGHSNADLDNGSEHIQDYAPRSTKPERKLTERLREERRDPVASELSALAGSET
jgi:hypothetical protein